MSWVFKSESIAAVLRKAQALLRQNMTGQWETTQNQTVRPGEHLKTPGAINWFVKNVLARDEVLDLKVVPGHPLPVLKAILKMSNGKAILVIGTKRKLELESMMHTTLPLV